MRVTRQRLADRTGEQAVQLARRDRAVRVGNRVAVRVVRRMTEHLVDPLDQPLGDDVFELLRLVVHFGPAHAHHLHQKELDEPVTPQHETGELFAGRRQPHAAVGLVLGEPRLGERLDHRRGRARRDAERRGDLAHRHQAVPAGSVDWP